MLSQGCVVRSVESFVVDGMDVDVPAFERPQHVKVAVFGCAVRSVGSTVVGGMDVDPSLFELDRDRQMAVAACPCGCR